MAGIVFFAVAQLADGLTYSPLREANALVLTLGPAALLAKVLLVCAVVCVASALSETRYRWVRQPLLFIGSVVGLVGTLTNL